jgi:hypothetical protein
MSQPQAATLRLVALDAYHRQLVGTMLELLGSRLRKAWSTSELAITDAILVDIDNEQGRRHVEQSLRTGLTRRIIALGRDTELDLHYRLAKPLRLHPLLAALSEIESQPGPDLPPAEPGIAPRYQLREWPELDAGTTPADELRIFAALSRRPIGVAEIARTLDLGLDQVAEVIARLDRLGLLARAAATTVPLGAVAGAAPAQRGFIAALRRRFGL